MPTVFAVRARWDDASGTWWTDGEDIPGLCCQAPSFEDLAEAVFGLAPELLVANKVVGPDAREVTVTLTAERRHTARLVA